MKDFYYNANDDGLWYKDAIIYELHVKAFYDSNDDGIGDFKGLTQKLDYFQDLGVTALWLLPFYPSPLRDDGYDVADYVNVNNQYGTLRDFKTFLKEAHHRNLRVITEIVINHTSDQHSWFQKARNAKLGSNARDFYVWSDTIDKYKEARIIFKDFERSNWTWDSVANAYFWHRFYSHQPDLNFDNPHVHKAVFKTLDYWLAMGVDGVRLDAIPYLYEREGTNCENLKETYEFLRKLRAYTDSRYKSKMFLAEANQWPEDAVAYFGGGDMCHMAFHFPLMPRLFMSVWMEDRFPIIDILDQTPAIPENCQWALFLRNHDELTLEMVTDEERDYMYNVYASDPVTRINLGIRRRLAPLLNNNRRKIEIMNILLFTLPGTPVIYYGDEIGMGDNYYLGDRDGVRTPMQWSPDRNAGFSRANPQKLYLPVIIDPDYHYEALNVESQSRNQSSLLWWMKRIIGMRKQFKSLSRGSLEVLNPDNSKVLAFIRQYGEETILIVVNLSRFSQAVELDLSRFAGHVPEEMISKNQFPVIKESPYLFTMGFYGYFFFLLKPQEALTLKRRQFIPEIKVRDNWQVILEGDLKEKLQNQILPSYIQECRWFGSKARSIQGVIINEIIPIGQKNAFLLFLEIRYTEGQKEKYLLPVSFITGDAAYTMVKENLQAVIVQIQFEHPHSPPSVSIAGTSDTIDFTHPLSGFVIDAVYDSAFQFSILNMIDRRVGVEGLYGRLDSFKSSFFKNNHEALTLKDARLVKAEQSNTAFLYSNLFFLKLYRRLEEGMNPDLEMERFLTERQNFKHVPPFLGAIEYKKEDHKPIVVGLLTGFTSNQGDAWSFTMDLVRRYFERVMSRVPDIEDVPDLEFSIYNEDGKEIDPQIKQLIGAFYIEMVELLGKRTAELHMAVASDSADHDFAPEPFNSFYQRSIYQSISSLVRRNFQTLWKISTNLPDSVKEEASSVLSKESEILDTIKAILRLKIKGMKIRTHGDYHLGQVLFTGNDFVIIDFEGEPARTLSERRLKRSPLRDVAGMLRSFHYAAYTGVLQQASVNKEYLSTLVPWANLWYKHIAKAFLTSYLNTLGDSPLVSKEIDELSTMLKVYLIEKAVYEIGYEMNNRPDWIIIPVKGVMDLLEG